MSDDDAQSHGGQTMAGNPWPKKSKRRAAMSKRKPKPTRRQLERKVRELQAALAALNAEKQR